MLEYIKISEKEKIKNKDIAKIIDYFERHSKKDIKLIKNKFWEKSFKYGIFDVNFDEKSKTINLSYDNFSFIYLKMRTSIFASNVSWLFQGIKKDIS